MDLFPTWQIWQLIHERIEADQRAIWQRLLGVKTNPNPLVSPLSNIWIWVIFSFVISVITTMGGRYVLLSSSISLNVLGLISSLGLALPLLAIIVSMRHALRLINVVMKQHEGGTYESFALLPDGEFGNLLNIARAYRYPPQGKIIGVLTFGVIFAIVLFGSFYSPESLFNVSSFARFDSVGANPASIMLRGVASLVGYLQSFVMALLLAMLTLRRAPNNEPRVWFIVGFIALQIGLYFVSHWISGYMGRYLETSTYQVIGIEIMFATISPFFISYTVIFTLLFELVNLILWQIVQRRLEV